MRRDSIIIQDLEQRLHEIDTNVFVVERTKGQEQGLLGVYSRARRMPASS